MNTAINSDVIADLLLAAVGGSIHSAPAKNNMNIAPSVMKTERTNPNVLLQGFLIR